MNHSHEHKSLSWLDNRIRETEARIVSEKQQLAELESKGLNTGHACRRLAITTEYLHMLNVRRAALLEKTPMPHPSEH